MLPQISAQSVSVIIATLGRPDMLKRCLTALTNQTIAVNEVLVVHCGEDQETEELARSDQWAAGGFNVRYFRYPERNAAKQRDFAIQQSCYDRLLLLDDDVEVEPRWVEELFKPIAADSEVAATLGNIVNQAMPRPTFLWRVYRMLLHGQEGLSYGRLVGAALPNGFPVDAVEPIRCEWIGGGASALRRDAYYAIGGFAPYFTGSSPGEDLDLGYRLSRSYKVYYVPTARCMHHHAPHGRERIDKHQYLSSRSRFGILWLSMGKSRLRAFAHVALWILVQTLSELASVRRGSLPPHMLLAWRGRIQGLLSCVSWRPEPARPLDG
jgi:GT2 family glycosyltransferase